MDTSEPVEDVQAQDQKMEKDADDKGMKKEEEENKEENKSVALDERREGVKEAVKDAGSEPQEAAPNAKTPPPPPTTPTPPASVVEPVVVIKTEPGLVSLAPAESNTIRPWSNGVIFSHRRAITPSGGAAVSAELVPITNGTTTTTTSSSRKTASPSSSPSLQSTAPAAPTNRVPSVILGQSGGVKTMVWTGHWADQQNKSNNSSSSSSSLSVSAPNAKPAPIHHNSDAASIRLSVDGLLSLASASALAQQNELRRHSSPSSIGRQLSSSPSQVHQ